MGRAEEKRSLWEGTINPFSDGFLEHEYAFVFWAILGAHTAATRL